MAKPAHRFKMEIAVSEPKPVRVGVIGLGVGEQHIRGYLQVPGVDVVAICDVDPDKLKNVGDRWGIGRRHADFRGITEASDIDVVSVCSYDDAHHIQCLSAFRHGKHVMVEKPVALFRHEAEAILRAQQDSGRLITSNLILRQVPRFKELRRQIADGEFGEIFAVEGDYVHDILWKITRGWRGEMAFYSTVYGGGIHLLDLMRWLIGQEVTEICGMSNKVLTAGTPFGFDDTFINVLRYSKGAIGKSMSTYGPRRVKFHAVKVFGTKRTFENDTPNAKLFTGDDPDMDVHEVRTPYPGIEKGDLIPDFIDAIRQGREPNVSARDVFRVMDICFAAVESVERKQVIPVSYMI